MATITRKVLKGRAYFYLRECQRVGGRPKIVRQEYLGTADGVAALVRQGIAANGGVRAAVDGASIERRFAELSLYLDERGRRLWAAAEAKAIGAGGSGIVSKATGISMRAIKRGRAELRAARRSPETFPDRIRLLGGGRKSTTAKDPTLLRDLEGLVDPVTRGDPESPLRWTCKSVRRLARALVVKGHQVSHRLVADLLHELGYSLHANSKTLEGAADHPDPDAQSEYHNEAIKKPLASCAPAISVDTKKKELIGPFKNGGRELRKKGDPEKVNVHDFIINDKDHGRVSPYGVYDIGANVGWVNVGTDHDTAAFAVESIRRWWRSMGVRRYPNAKKLVITADSGGSNGARVKLWKKEMQRFANELGFPITIHHLPPGTSKWNKIEHRLFSFISQNWRGKPLTSHEVIINLIASTTTTKGLKVHCRLDKGSYPKGIKVTAREMAALKLQLHDFHGDWNYTISPA